MKLIKKQKAGAGITDSMANLSVIGIFRTIENAVTELTVYVDIAIKKRLEEITLRIPKEDDCPYSVFFDKHMDALSLYEAFESRVMKESIFCQNTSMEVCRGQKGIYRQERLHSGNDCQTFLPKIE